MLCYLWSIESDVVLQDLFLLILFQTGEMGLDMGAQGDPLAYRQDGEWRFITQNQTRYPYWIFRCSGHKILKHLAVPPPPVRWRLQGLPSSLRAGFPPRPHDGRCRLPC